MNHSQKGARKLGEMGTQDLQEEGQGDIQLSSLRQGTKIQSITD